MNSTVQAQNMKLARKFLRRQLGQGSARKAVALCSSAKRYTFTNEPLRT